MSSTAPAGGRGHNAPRDAATSRPAGGPAPDVAGAGPRNRGPVLTGLLLALGPALFCLVYFVPGLTGLDDAPRAVLATTAWVASWWVTEAIPIPATSLIPLFLLPISGGTDQATAAGAYANPTVFMYMGGFIIAVAIQRWGLHQRIAMTAIRLVGTKGNRITLGIILATAVMSMWISNAATALMMLPIGLAIVKELKNQDVYGEEELRTLAKGMLLSIAYAASIGGLATLIGSVPNAVFAAQAGILFGEDVSFAQWFVFAAPLTIVLLAALYGIMCLQNRKVAFRAELPKDFINEQLRALGPMSYEEKVVGAVFVVVGALWLSSGFLPDAVPLTDASISIMGAVAMFVVPAKARRGGILVWEDMTKLPWGVLVLFGGGLSLAAAFEDSGLTPWFGERLSELSALPFALMIVVLGAVVLLMTEILSNTAVANMLIPISASLALGIGADPYAIMILVALTTSCAFMLPIATPPNAAVFSSPYVTMSDMMRAGAWLNVAALAVIAVAVFFWQPVVLPGPAA